MGYSERHKEINELSLSKYLNNNFLLIHSSFE